VEFFFPVQTCKKPMQIEYIFWFRRFPNVFFSRADIDTSSRKRVHNCRIRIHYPRIRIHHTWIRKHYSRIHYRRNRSIIPGYGYIIPGNGSINPGYYYNHQIQIHFPWYRSSGYGFKIRIRKNYSTYVHVLKGQEKGGRDEKKTGYSKHELLRRK
jgi:hypothetical protein